MTKAGLGETRVEIQLPRPGQWLPGLCSRVSNPAGKLPSLPAARWARANSYTLKYAECKHPGCPHLSPPPSSCRGVTTPAWSRPMGSVTTLSTNGRVSPGSRPMGSVAVSRCPRAADQWEAAASLVQHTRPASTRHGETRRQAGKLVPPAPS